MGFRGEGIRDSGEWVFGIQVKGDSGFREEGIRDSGEWVFGIQGRGDSGERGFGGEGIGTLRNIKQYTYTHIHDDS